MMGWVKDGRQWTAVADWRLDWRLLNLEKDHRRPFTWTRRGPCSAYALAYATSLTVSGPPIPEEANARLEGVTLVGCLDFKLQG